jgi:hypothetical protein
LGRNQINTWKVQNRCETEAELMSDLHPIWRFGGYAIYKLRADLKH